MFIQPKLLKSDALNVSSKIFVCGPGYSSSEIAIRNIARDALNTIPNVSVVYGEQIEKEFRYRQRGTDLQTLEAQFAHDVDFTLLILESPGSIAELGTFTQFIGVQERLIVLVSNRFYRAESYIARGPLSLLTKRSPNSVIYFDPEKLDDLRKKVLYPLTFFKFAHYRKGYSYLKNTRISLGSEAKRYGSYIKPIREDFNKALTLISIIAHGKPNYAELLLISGLAPKQLNSSLHFLYEQNTVEKVGSGKYNSVSSYDDPLISEFNSTSISRERAKLLALS